MNTKDAVLGALRERTNEYVSGSQIASHLNISRNAVWKAIEQLRADGYKINAVTHKGYRLTALSDKLVPDIITRYLEELGVPAGECVPVHFYNVLPDTNAKVKEFVSQNAPHGTSVVARLRPEDTGPAHTDTEADNVYMSIIFHTNDSPWSTSIRIMHMCVIAVHSAIRKMLGITCSIRDHDSLYYMGRRICDFHIEAAGELKKGVRSLRLALLGISIYGKGFAWNRPLLVAQILKNILFDTPDSRAAEAAYKRLCE